MSPEAPSPSIPGAYLHVQPTYIQVSHEGEEATLPHFRIGHGQRRILILGGIHGREHGGIQAAFELLKHLEQMSIEGQIDVLPICNPMAFKAETRDTPGNDRDMARAFTTDPPQDLTEALSHAILRIAGKAEVVYNLHSAGDARYLPHVIFYRHEDTDRVARMGFPFAIKRGTPESLLHHIASRMRSDQLTVTLELGGGTVSFPDEVNQGVQLILANLRQLGILPSVESIIDPTPKDQVWLTDSRVFVRAPTEGAFYTHAMLGTDFSKEQTLGYWVGLEDYLPRLIDAPVDGKLIYLRTRNRVPSGETLAMFLPPQE
jgi:predicted deacylase